MASAVLTASFEEEIARQVMLAFFVPAVVCSGRCCRHQTGGTRHPGISQAWRCAASWCARSRPGCSSARSWRSPSPCTVAVGGDLRLAVAVSLALLVSCVTATVVAVSLPYAFARSGRDPAFGSGPLATVIQDLLSIAVYFALAVSLA